MFAELYRQILAVGVAPQVLSGISLFKCNVHKK